MMSCRKNISLQKSNGRFYTPQDIVNNVLDLSGYYGAKILKKHVIDNSCGDGAFLIEITRRYCENAIQAGISKDETALQLVHYIHGIEIDPVECNQCVMNVSRVAAEYGIYNVQWDIRCSDAMDVREYDGKMDYVLGNPPYIRVHNAGKVIDKIKKFSFAQNGMVDVFIVFYELGLNMLKKDGVLGYITPNSFFSSIAGESMRKYFIQHNLIEKIVDLKHFQAFSTTTYTTIVVLKNGKQEETVSYYCYDEKRRRPQYVDSLVPDEFFIGQNFYFSNKNNLKLLRRILNNSKQCNISVKNGYAKLCDDDFVGDFDFSSDYLIPVIKASTGKTKRILYPYDKNSNLVSEQELQRDGNVYKYLIDHKGQLLKRSGECKKSSSWYAFGRSQAINDTFRDKLTINTLVRTSEDLKMIYAPAGTGVYSGLYMIGDPDNIEKAKKALFTDEFTAYISLLGKYRSGGYYTFSSKDIKAFLDYKLAYNGGIST